MSYFNIIKLNATSSTNDFLKRKHYLDESKDGDLIWAIDQKKGKGQRSNKWHSEVGKSLTFSIYKQFDDLLFKDAFLISASISISIIEVLKKLGCKKVSVKWPNDIMADGKKIGGILIENIIKGNLIKSSIIGVGLNINQDKFKDLPNATSLYIETNQKNSLDKVLVYLCDDMKNSIINVLLKKNNYIINKFSKLLWKKNSFITFSINETDFKAILRGISSQGNLLLEFKNGKLKEFDLNHIKINYSN
jgi:BirA family biotin operon repressor/biotin-[acetyl-CoA-carboxylase] ligase